MLMKRLFVSLVGIMALGLVSYPVNADAPTGQAMYPLAFTYDLDGEGADADQVVVVGDGVIADAKVYNLTANPDVCRLVDVTYVNGGGLITAGTLTVTGTDCWGEVLVTTLNLNTASGVKNLVVPAGSPASGAYYRTITDIRNGAITGETGAETITVGYTTGSPNQYVAYGKRNDLSDGTRRVDPAGVYPVGVRIQNNTTTTLIATTLLTAPFRDVVVGDLLYLPVKGAAQIRRVSAKADNDNVTVNSAIALDTAGVTFSFARFYISSDPVDGWLPVSGWDAGAFVFVVDANADVGGVVSTVECTLWPGGPFGFTQVDTDTIATGTTGSAVSSIDFRLAPYRFCRFGMKFGTNDDADAANENISVGLGLRK